MVDTAVRRGDVYLVQLNPTRDRKIKKTRPCVVVSPDELNAHMEGRAPAARVLRRRLDPGLRP